MSKTKGAKGFLFSLLPRRSTGEGKKSAASPSNKTKLVIHDFIRQTLEKEGVGQVDARYARILHELEQNDGHYKSLAEHLDHEFILAYVTRLAPLDDIPPNAKPVQDQIIDEEEEEEEEEEEDAEYDYDYEHEEEETLATRQAREELNDPWALALMRVPSSSYWCLAPVSKRTLSFITSPFFQQARSAVGCSQQEVIVVFGDNGFSETPSSACLCLSRDLKGWTHRDLASLPTSVSWGCAPRRLINDELYLVCGNQDGIASTAFLAYNASEDNWRLAPPLPAIRHFSVCCVVKGNLVVMGGQMPNTGVTSTAVEYDPRKRCWSELPDMPYAVSSAQAGVVNNLIYVAGGFGEYAPERRLAEYAYEKKTWSLREEMPKPRNKGAAVVFLSKLVVLGGYGEDCSSTDSMYIYNPSCDKWSEGPTLPEPSVYGHAAIVGDSILHIRGSDDVYKTRRLSPFLLDTKSGGWSKLAELPHEAPVVALSVLSKF